MRKYLLYLHNITHCVHVQDGENLGADVVSKEEPVSFPGKK